MPLKTDQPAHMLFSQSVQPIYSLSRGRSSMCLRSIQPDGSPVLTGACRCCCNGKNCHWYNGEWRFFSQKWMLCRCSSVDAVGSLWRHESFFLPLECLVKHNRFPTAVPVPIALPLKHCIQHMNLKMQSKTLRLKT